ncbi:MAG TPA: ATP-binding protein, partial [bacterium]|nr:ATP-binding protein [bacterium]
MPEEEKNNLTPTYTAEDIAVLEGLEPVRKRPGMYIGGTGVEGLHHLLWEVLDNSIDEALAGYANNITLTLEDNNIASVFDDGRGIPVDVHKQTGKTALETVLTTLHAGGKFGGAGYKVSGGLHGVGVSVVNALSIMMRAEIFRDGKMHVQEYSRGEAKGPVEQTQDTEKHGTKITFQPDKEIFKDIEFDWKTIVSRCRQQA